MGKTVAEKAFARASGNDEVAAGQFVDARIDRIVADEEFYRMHAVAVQAGLEEGIPAIWDHDRFHVILEHFQPALRADQALRQRKMRELAKRYALKSFTDVTCGVIHQIAIEDYVVPGELSLGADSHSCSWGAVNCVGTGMGEHELVYALSYGELWFHVPQTIQVMLQGSLQPGVCAKDIVLFLAREYGSEFGLYKSLEFTGPGASELSVDSRMTISTHAVELGAKFGLFDYDEKTAEFLARRSRGKDQLSNAKPIAADSDAEYLETVTVDLSALEPQVARPHRFDNVVPVEEVVGTKIDQAQVGSCANGQVEDLAIVAKVMKGRRVHPDTRFFVQPASWRVYRDCMELGIVAELLDAGVQVLQPGCHLCVGMQGALGAGDTCISSTTRNHKGRIGSSDAQVYLAGPETVAVSAIAGCITDPRKEKK